MTGLRRRSCRLAAAALLAIAVAIPLDAQPRPWSAAPAAAEGPAVTITAAVDRPAIWVADRLSYTIAVTCRAGIDILVDDLAPDKLTLGGLDLVSSDSARYAEAGAPVRYEFHYVLTTYHVDTPLLTIAPTTVRYYVARPGQRPDAASPAGSVQVPAASIAFRSLLPDDQPSYAARDGRPVEPRWLPYRILLPVGLGLILLSVVPVVFVAVGFARRTRVIRDAPARRSARQSRQAAMAALAGLGAADPATIEARRDAFARLDVLLRRHLAEVCGVPAPDLTPDEIVAAIAPCAGRVPIESVSAILASCELARYAGDDLLPSAEEWRATLALAEPMLAAGR